MPTGWKQCKAPKGERPKENITKTTNKIVNILGQNYTVRFENTRTENVLKNADGECRWYKKEIIIDDGGKGKIIPIKREFDGNVYDVIVPIELIEEQTNDNE